MGTSASSVTTQPLMTPAEAKEAVSCIRSGMESIGATLLALYDRQGWKALGYPTWRDCVQAEFGWGKTYAYDQLRAARITLELSAIAETVASPTNEAQARELARIFDPEERARVWQEVTEEHGEKVTAADIRRAASSAPPPLTIIDLETGEIIDPEEEEDEPWHEQRRPLARRPERMETKPWTPHDDAQVGAKNARIVLERTRDEMHRDLTWLENIDYGQLDARTQDEWRGCLALARDIVSLLERSLS